MHRHYSTPVISFIVNLGGGAESVQGGKTLKKFRVSRKFITILRVMISPPPNLIPGYASALHTLLLKYISNVYTIPKLWKFIRDQRAWLHVKKYIYMYEYKVYKCSVEGLQIKMYINNVVYIICSILSFLELLIEWNNCRR